MMDDLREMWMESREENIHDVGYQRLIRRQGMVPVVEKALDVVNSRSDTIGRWSRWDHDTVDDGRRNIDLAITVLADLNDILNFEVPGKYLSILPDIGVDFSYGDDVIVEWNIGVNVVVWMFGGSWHDSMLILIDFSKSVDLPDVTAVRLTDMTIEDYVWPLSSFVLRSVKALESTAA